MPKKKLTKHEFANFDEWFRAQFGKYQEVPTNDEIRSAKTYLTLLEEKKRKAEEYHNKYQAARYAWNAAQKILKIDKK